MCSGGKERQAVGIEKERSCPDESLTSDEQVGLEALGNQIPMMHWLHYECLISKNGTILRNERTARYTVRDRHICCSSLVRACTRYTQSTMSPFMTNKKNVGSRCYTQDHFSSIEDFAQLISRTTSSETYPLARHIEKNVPLYDHGDFDLDDGNFVERLQDEWYHVLLNGPGVFVIKNFIKDLNCIDAANAAYKAIIAQEKAQSNGSVKGDHFANAATNDRIWNSLSKHCIQDPTSFLDYYSTPLFRLVCEAYLGPAYRLTAQVNIVKPGGKAQVCHRDYHMGFQTAATAAQWPKAMHYASQLLTLQGAVAHSDMPVESGPTRLLPFSQLFESGYLAYRRDDFKDFFLKHYISLPLEKGDALFFNPALFHAAGENCTSDFERSANLIQISSAFGKPMESIDRVPLVQGTWNPLRAKYNKEGLSAEVETFLTVISEGYPFPTNLDRRPPAPNGMAPESETDVLRRGLEVGWSVDEAVQALRNVIKDAEA